MFSLLWLLALIGHAQGHGQGQGGLLLLFAGEGTRDTTSHTGYHMAGSLTAIRGQISAVSSTVTKSKTLLPPDVSLLSPPTAWCMHPYIRRLDGGFCAMIVGAFEPRQGEKKQNKGEYEVFITRSPDPLSVLGYAAKDLIRYTTKDFRTYSKPETVHTFDESMPKASTWDIESIARREDTGEYLMVVVNVNLTVVTCTLDWRGCMVYTYSSPDGKNWTPLQNQNGSAAYYDHDTAGLVWDQNHFEWVAMQTTDQQHHHAMSDLGVCDNDGCEARRVMSTYSSQDGVSLDLA